ncbi:hypothetical protein ACQYWY_21615 [Comamonas sediminis]|uniref:hypothetical protein n=1 Tax=Comamonas sediminis TaxID=1783360 RepID=UPI003D28DBBA
MNGWFGFWIFCAVWVLAEVYITTRGIDTVLWQFKTPAELELQQRLIDKAAQAKKED